MFLAIMSLTAQSTTINGKFVLFNSDTTLGVKLCINTDTGNDDLGGATFIVNFDSASLSFNSFPVEGHDYIFHNFSGGSYEKGTVTNVLADQIWINIELSADNEGTLISGRENWTDVVTIYFPKKHTAEEYRIEAESGSIYWSVFDADNSTLWSAGEFVTEKILTGTKERNNIPEQFELCQNYPNPFNPSTKIIFRLKNGGNTKLILYDLLGKKIETVVENMLEAGNYEVEIDGTDLASGFYIYSLTVEGEYSAVKKMVLLK
jgi:hypothetical protein